jgi:hypothetical protein
LHTETESRGKRSNAGKTDEYLQTVRAGKSETNNFAKNKKEY